MSARAGEFCWAQPGLWVVEEQERLMGSLDEEGPHPRCIHLDRAAKEDIFSPYFRREGSNLLSPKKISDILLPMYLQDKNLNCPFFAAFHLRHLKGMSLNYVSAKWSCTVIDNIWNHFHDF